MGKKIIRVVVILMVLAIFGWVVAYSTSITLQRKYDARSYGNFLLKEEEEELKKDYPIDKIKYSWSLWITPQGKLNDAWGAYPPDNAFVCSIHIYQLEKPILSSSSVLTQNKNFYSHRSKEKYFLDNDKSDKTITEFGSQWYSLREFNIDYFKSYLDTRFSPFYGEFKGCIESFVNQNKKQRESIVIPNGILNKASEDKYYTKDYGHQNFPFLNLLKNSSYYFSVLFSFKSRIRFEGNCHSSVSRKVNKNNIDTTKFYIYDEEALTLSTIQIKGVLNLKACQP